MFVLVCIMSMCVVSVYMSCACSMGVCVSVWCVCSVYVYCVCVYSMGVCGGGRVCIEARGGHQVS